MNRIFKVAGSGFLLMVSTGLQADIVHLDDVITVGSHCIGQDCVNGESFGFDTLRFKENNLRIHFQDTSASASFPTNDWRIIINDSANGGANYFGVEDSNAARIPFRIEAGAPANALYVESDGDVGIGTSNPVVDIHVANGNTPTLRLEQNGSSGFTAQTWDVAGNEANFFVRDATNGSKLPFKIKPGAPTNALFVAANGNIGLGTQSPAQHLHVHSTDGSAQVLIEDINGTAAPRTLLKMENKGNTKFSLINTDAGSEWSFANPGTGLRISKQGSGVVEMELSNEGSMTIAGNGTTKFTIDNIAANTEWGIANAGGSMRLSKQGSGAVEMEIFGNGNITVAGAITQNSDVNAKTAITEIDPGEILGLISQLPVTKWEYKDARGESHIGPMAQDFYAAFGLGVSETGISTIDTAGVALVAIKALVEKTESLELNIEELQRENQLLAARQLEKLDKVDQLEQMVNLLMQAQENTRVLTSIN